MTSAERAVDTGQSQVPPLISGERCSAPTASGWYVNLEEPYAPAPRRVQTKDLG
jgi:hypothetical protein